MEIDYDYLQTGTAIGFRASRELCSNYLLCNVAVCLIVRTVIGRINEVNKRRAR